MPEARADRAAALAAPSIAFTREELVVLSELARLRLPLLGDRPLGGVDAGVRDVIVGSARRSLLARGIVTRSDEGVRVARAALGLLEIVAAGSLRVVLDQSDRVGTRLARRLWFAVPYAAVEVWVDLDDNIRFLPFATADLLTRVLGHTGLVDATDGAGPAVPLTHGAWIDARHAVQEGRTGDALHALTDAGLDERTGQSVVRALEAGRQIWGVQLVHHPSPSTTAGGEVAWLDAGDAGVWSVPTVDQPFASADVRANGWLGEPAEGSDDVTEAPDPDLAALPIELAPVTRQDILDVLQSCLPQPS